jgi:hypothetical protein
MARTTVLAVHAQGLRGPAAGERFAAHGAAGHRHALAAATRFAHRAELAIDAAGGQQLAGGRSIVVVVGAQPPATFVVLGAHFAGGAAFGDGGARFGHARATAAVGGGQAGAADRETRRAATESSRASERTASAGLGAGLAVRGAPARADTRARVAAARIRPTDEGATIGACPAGRALTAAGGARAVPLGALSGTAIAVLAADARVGRTAHGRRRGRHRQLDLPPAAPRQDGEQRGPGQAEAARGHGGVPPATRVRARGAANPRGNSSR